MLRKLLKGTLWLLIVGSLVLAGWWAGRHSLFVTNSRVVPPAVPTYVVTEATLGRAFTYEASAQWSVAPGPINRLHGTITSVNLSPDKGTEVQDGSQLYSVDRVPVVVAEGTLPLYRDMGPGIAGPDVQELEAFLERGGFLTRQPGAKFQASTRSAVQSWQRSLGAPESGTVQLGALIFVDDLPQTVLSNDQLRIGSPVSDGASLMAILAPAPDWTISLSPDQVGGIPRGSRVDVQVGTTHLSGATGDVRETDGVALVDLVGSSGETLCPGKCTGVPVLGVSKFPVTVTVSGPTTGPVVPVAALTTEPDGTITVSTPTGPKVVVVQLQVGGQAIVKGIVVGDILLLPVNPA